jgi:uncharacterized membrane protein YfcA
MAWLLVLGLLAGALTTVAGLGGGQLLVLALATVAGPREALAISAPALLAGNLHRFALYRAHADVRAAVAFAAGAVPASALAGWLAVSLPPWLLSLLLGATTLFAVGRGLGLIKLAPPPNALPAAGAIIGAICATSSGAGMLLAPLLLATGLTGPAYIATGALCAASMHIGRVAGYAAGGGFGVVTLGQSALLAVAIVGGNLLGDRSRSAIPARAEPWIEHATLVTCVALAIVQLF